MRNRTADPLPVVTHPARSRFWLFLQLARFSRTRSPTLHRDPLLIGENTDAVLAELQAIEDARQGRPAKGAFR
jgi:crotonobetainyl-CoA:carnitine CoA-transferase CaiB-like acyl-CoA transferase